MFHRIVCQSSTILANYLSQVLALYGTHSEQVEFSEIPRFNATCGIIQTT